MLNIIRTSRFKKDWKRIKSSGHFNESNFHEVVFTLACGKRLDARYKDHALGGKMIYQRECHLKPDLLLIYEISEDEVKLARIGSHSELFG